MKAQESMDIETRPMTMEDYPQAIRLWESTPGIGVSSADQADKMARFLERNPGMSFIARVGGRLVGTVLCGHDGRRGYLYHMAVREKYRRMGIAMKLGEACMAALRKAGIEKCHILVYSANSGGLSFWKETGWIQRDELTILSHPLTEG